MKTFLLCINPICILAPLGITEIILNFHYGACAYHTMPRVKNPRERGLLTVIQNCYIVFLAKYTARRLEMAQHRRRFVLITRGGRDQPAHPPCVLEANTVGEVADWTGGQIMGVPHGKQRSWTLVFPKELFRTITEDEAHIFGIEDQLELPEKERSLIYWKEELVLFLRPNQSSKVVDMYSSPLIFVSADLT